MAFICPSHENAERRRQLLCQLKQMVREVENECYVPCKMCCPVPCCPPACASPQGCVPCSPPSMMVCYRVPSKKEGSGKGNISENKKDKVESKKVKVSKSRELRGGNLYIGCECEKLNGLQDDCRRSECRGSPECLTHPPTCGPSEFSGAKHLLKKQKFPARKGAESSQAVGDSDPKKSTKKDVTEKYQCYPAYIELPKCPCVCPAC